MKSKPSITGSQRRYLRQKVFYLSTACPSGHGNLCACPFYTVRKMSVMERFEWHRELSDLELLGILAHHQKCLMKKTDLKHQDHIKFRHPPKK
jgi:hypothetical protein